MRKIGFAMLAFGLIAGCGGKDDDGALTTDERQRLENIAERLDKEVPLPEPAETDTQTDTENDTGAEPTENIAD